MPTYPSFRWTQYVPGDFNTDSGVATVASPETHTGPALPSPPAGFSFGWSADDGFQIPSQDVTLEDTGHLVGSDLTSYVNFHVDQLTFLLAQSVDRGTSARLGLIIDMNGHQFLNLNDTETPTAIQGDIPVTGTVEFVDAASSIAEVDDGTVAVERPAGTNITTTVDWATSDGSGVAGVNYVADSGTLSWAPLDTADKLIPVETLLSDDGTIVNRPFHFDPFFNDFFATLSSDHYMITMPATGRPDSPSDRRATWGYGDVSFAPGTGVHTWRFKCKVGDPVLGKDVNGGQQGGTFFGLSTGRSTNRTFQYTDNGNNSYVYRSYNGLINHNGGESSFTTPVGPDDGFINNTTTATQEHTVEQSYDSTTGAWTVTVDGVYAGLARMLDPSMTWYPCICHSDLGSYTYIDGDAGQATFNITLSNPEYASLGSPSVHTVTVTP